MSNREVFVDTIEKKRERLEELAERPLGERFLHHTIVGLPGCLRSSIPYTIVKHGLLNGKDRGSNPETAFRTSNTWYGDTSPVYLFDDSYNSFRVGSDGIQLMDVIVDPKILEDVRYSKTTNDSRDLFDSYLGEVAVPESIGPEYILGAIVSTRGHNKLWDFQTRPEKDPEQLKVEDKARYASFGEGHYKGTVREENDDGGIEGHGAFYRGLVWGMGDFPGNAFPVFTGFSSSHFPYESSSRVLTGERADDSNEIPFEYYLAGQIFPLTGEAHLRHAIKDIVEKRGVSPRQFGLGVRCGKGLITPEQVLGREMSEEERGRYVMVRGGR